MKFRMDAEVKAKNPRNLGEEEDVRKRALDFEAPASHHDPHSHVRCVSAAIYKIIGDLERQCLTGEGPPFSDGRFFLQPELEIVIKVKEIPSH